MEFQSGYERNVETIPVGELGIIALKSCETLGKKIDAHIVKWRKEREHEHLGTPELRSYARDSYLIDASVPRFGSGEAKGIINDLSLIHISSPRDLSTSRMPSSA